MGAPGSKKSPAAAEASAALVDDLAPLGEVSARPMFGGFGVFHGSVMFAIVDPQGGCFLRADETTSADFEAAGAERHARMPYWLIPPAVRSDGSELVTWASRALTVARAAKA